MLAMIPAPYSAAKITKHRTEKKSDVGHFDRPDDHIRHTIAELDG